MNEELQRKVEDALVEGSVGGLSQAIPFSWSGIISGLLFGIIGMWLLGRGRKRGNFKLVAISFALMFYPYFTTGPWADWGVGVGLCGLAWYIWRN